MELCKTPELACSVTIQPIARFPLDAAILFSDILTIPDAMGLGLGFKKGEGPAFERPLRNAQDVQALTIPDPEVSLRYVLDTIRMVQHELAGKVPLIGFCGSPWTMACYMVEGQKSREFPTIKQMIREQPMVLHKLLDILAQAVSMHFNAQIKAGVQAVMLFDTWGGMLDTQNYLEFSLRYAKQIRANLLDEYQGKNIPTILFTKGGGQWLESMAEAGYDAIGLDWLVDLGEARQRIGNRVALQGNMNPEFLYRSPEEIKTEVGRILQSYGSGSGHVFNLGHGILPDASPDHLGVLIDAVHSMSRPYHNT